MIFIDKARSLCLNAVAQINSLPLKSCQVCLYLCVILISGSYFIVYVLIYVVPLPRLIISQSVNGSVSGLDHTLTCTVVVVNGVQSDLVMISWTGGSSLSSSPRVTTTDQTNVGLVYTRTVIFSPLLNGDGGQYTCSVTVTGFDEADSTNNTMVMVNGM